MKTQIINGTVMDGTGVKGYPGAILIEDDKIIALVHAQEQPDWSADKTIDAKGTVVCPGFIDTHSHSDLAVLMEHAIEPKLHQGITTEILGQDGVSMAPLPEEYVQNWRLNIGGLEGDAPDAPWHRLKTVEAYLDLAAEKRSYANIGYLVPHGNLRLSVMGFSDAPASQAQIDKMGALLRESLDAGAVGLSTGLVYVPCVYAQTEELVQLCRIAAEDDVPFVVHQRYESDRILESMKELLDVALESGVHLHISHFKITGVRNAQKRFDVFKLIDEYRARGVVFTADQYPYIAGSTMLGRIIPPWAHIGGTEQLIQRMCDPATREKIKDDILYTRTVWDNMVSVCTQNGIIVTSVNKPENQECVGKSIVEIGEMRHTSPLDAAMDLLVSERNQVGMICQNGVEETMRDILVRTDVNVCTDGLLGGTPHPRVYGAFPRVLGHYVRQEKLLTLETAVAKMTQRAAQSFHLVGRGELKPGNYADIVLFDPETVVDVGTYQNPRQFARGIQTVLVNGKVVLSNGQVDANAASGRVLRLNKG